MKLLELFMEVFIMEKDIEQALIGEIRKAGGLCLKFVSPGWSGAPDRICILPGGRVTFVELKTPGKQPRPLQVKRLSQLAELGCRTFVVDDAEKARQLAQELMKC